MLEAHAFETLLAIGHQIGVKVGGDLPVGPELATQEAENVGTGIEGGVADQTVIDAEQSGAIAEQDVGGPFGLLGRPIVLRRELREDLLVQRIERGDQVAEDGRPVGLPLLIGELLGLIEVLQPGEAVVLTAVGEAGLVHLPS